MKTVQWRLQKGQDRRFRSGHPWVYSNELQESPKGIEPGAPVELCDSAGKLLARGYGNASSLIAFRALSRNPELQDPWGKEALKTRLLSALRLREMIGVAQESFRWVFGEADGIPGLIIDRFKLHSYESKENTQVIVIQAHSAGVDRLLPELLEALEVLAPSLGCSWKRTAVVIRNDLEIRKLEGLTQEEPRVHQAIEGLDLKHALIRVRSAVNGGTPVIYQADLIEGQKTGFFLDQVDNIGAFLSHWKPKAGDKPLQILDLCCYVGQWSAQIAAELKKRGFAAEFTLFDASESALGLAQKNVASQGAKVSTIKGDVLKDLAQLKDRSFDLVISDPPALVRGRKNIPTGTHAYLQLNTQAMRLVRDGGFVVSCSCSALLEEEAFSAVLAKAAQRNSKTARWVGRGAQASDHPVLAEFPEGKYLKAYWGSVEG